jgi:hypothetical protein
MTAEKRESHAKWPVNPRAVMQRLNREFKADGETRQVKKSRGERMKQEHGEYYIVDHGLGFIVFSDIDLEKWGREYKVLKDWETVAD